MPGLRPVFLIGDDSLSRSWLKLRRARLKRLNALGLVVKLTSSQQLEALRQLGQGLQMIPASGNDLAVLLNLRHYPVLITATYVEQ